ncbi:dienelactone hydrolase family protein [Candidatus Nitrospira bockiana]
MAETVSDRDLKERMVQYPSDGVTVRAYAVAPAVKERRPAIIIVQEWWGLNDHIKDIARRYAKEGYVAIAPDLYSRLGNRVTTDANEAGKLMNTLQQQDGLKDLQATIAYLKTTPEVDPARIGVTGFCMGGSYALMLPCTTGEIKAAVPFYGQVPNPDTPLQKLACPILYIYGEEDGWITKADVQRLAAALKKYGKSGEIKTYPGASHAFFNDTRKEVYKPAEAKDAWTRAVAFFKQHLG